jgi:hypothetical protein
MIIIRCVEIQLKTSEYYTYQPAHFNPEDGSSILLRNMNTGPQNYTLSQTSPED